MRAAVVLWGVVLVLLLLGDSALAMDEGDEEDEEDDDEFDFMSSKLDFPTAAKEVACDAASGECKEETEDGVASVVKRGLVTKKPKVAELLREHERVAAEMETRAFRGETLGYVTPWNPRGYDWALRFRTKFTYISPVWLQIREDTRTHAPMITGRHDINAGWTRAARGHDGRGPKIVPRIVYERNKLASEDIPYIIELLLSIAGQHGWDGFVIEMPVNTRTADFLLKVGQALKDHSLMMILVLPQSSPGAQWSVQADVLQALLPVVHRFSMNAYDYQQPGPNAPLTWIRNTLERGDDSVKRKLLMGIPFYGYDNNNAVTGSAYVKALAKEDISRLRWDADAHECFHEYIAEDRSTHHVYYPCLQFLNDRLRLYEEHHVGAAIWEVGQGLDFFAEML